MFTECERMADTLKRVKLYALNADKVWIDKGTGRIISTTSEDKQYFLKVFSEIDESLLLDMKVLSDISFEKQQETLILWCDRDDNEFALSFQDKEGCDAIWRVIRCAREKENNINFSNDFVIYDSDDAADDLFVQDLPPLEPKYLKDINEIINKIKPAHNEKLSAVLLKGNYVIKLLGMFHLCESQNNHEGLIILCDIFKRVISLGNTAIFEEIFKKERIFDVVGCFEYDRAFCFPKQHRDFLADVVKHKEVSSSLNPELLDKIHQTYRVQYIQDVILPSINALEESILLSPFLYHNKVSIVNMIQDDLPLLSELFDILENRDSEIIKRKNILLFLKELLTFSQNLQTTAQNSFYKDLIDMKIIHALETSFQAGNSEMKLSVIEILNFFVEYSPVLVRKYMLEQADMLSHNVPLIILLVNGIISETESEYGCSLHLLALFKLLLHPDNMESTLTKSDKTDFLNYFYENALDLIIQPILSRAKENYILDEKSFMTILELLEFCVEHHSYHMRNIILHKDLIRHIVDLLKTPHKVLSLSVLRFMRKVIALKDEFYNRYIISGNLLAPVIEIFLKNEGRYNMLDSAILEMFELIRMEEIKSLCCYIMERFGKVLDDVKYVQTFKCLKHTYEQNYLQTKEKSIPMYLQNCFKEAQEDCPSLKFEIYNSNDENTSAVSSVAAMKGDFQCVEMELEVQAKDVVKKVSGNTCRLQSIIGEHSPIFTTVGHISRSKVSSSNIRNSKRRLLSFDTDEEEEEIDGEPDEVKKNNFSFGSCKRLCLNLP